MRSRTVLPAVALGAGIATICILQVANIMAAYSLESEVREMTNGDATQGGGTHTSEWVSGGIAHTHTTRRGENDPAETAAQHAARHAEELAAMLVEFPKDS